MKTSRLFVAVVTTLAGCLSEAPEGLAPAPQAVTTVKVDLFHQPLPEMPLPNDLATRYDSSSATGRRINASLVAPTRFESHTRALIDQLDGWGVFQQISIPFSGPLDIGSILRGHRDLRYDLANDVVYLINVDRRSPQFGRVHPLDVGNGNYPVVLKSLDKYWKNDPRGWTLSMLFEEADEDLNGNGKLDPGEDTDADGVLDRPNYLPGMSPARTDLKGRADALMYFHDRETNTLILRPLEPLDERTTYAVVVTRRLKDAAGNPVGSPYPFINHATQTPALLPLRDLLPNLGLRLDDIAFTFSFTTQSVQSQLMAVRDGLYGKGVQAHLGQQYPAELAGVERVRDPAKLAYVHNPYIIYAEELVAAIKPIANQLLGMDDNSEEQRVFLEAQQYVDFHVIGSFKSPQLFQRTNTTSNAAAVMGEEGGACLFDGTCQPGLSCLARTCVRLLPLNAQSWPQDLDRVAAQPREETVYFWLTVPRKEISARGQGKPAPIVVLGHGYGSSRTEILAHSGLLARQGFATLAIDCPSHGLGLSAAEEALVRSIGGVGYAPLTDALLKDRAFDQNNDGKKDSGADFWSAYVFHTRDMVRQAALDYMQLLRLFRSFDGARRSKLDLNGDGQPELAGDFDGDGAVDAGGDAPIAMTGGSLGGIMSLYMGSVEPNISMIAPVSGGAGLPDIGIRSRQGGVPEAFYLRVMGPLYVGTLDSQTSEMKIETIVPDLNHAPTMLLASVKGVQPGDTMVAENLANGSRGCGYVSPEGTVRVAVESDAGDPTRLELFGGDVLEATPPGVDQPCRLRAGARPTMTVGTFGKDVTFQGKRYTTGEPLVALAEGLGLRRATPGLRRFMSFGQIVIDPGDPAAFLRHLFRERLTYPGTRETTGAHALIITTIGDMNVPASTGIAAARIAGVLDYLVDDPRYGKPANQVLIDTYNVEAVSTLKRYVDPSGQGVHLDVDNFSATTDRWGTDVPRLAPPLRSGWERTDPLGGISAALFPMSDPTGQHGFDLPGQMTDKARKQCSAACTQTGANPCGCKTLVAFDAGQFMFTMIGRYFASGGTFLSDDHCNSRNDCPDRRPVPAVRDPKTLP